jgi:outer membrane protein with beta-barrel domain
VMKIHLSIRQKLMKKYLLLLGCSLFVISAFAQKTPSLANRPNDHILIQFGYLGWTGKPDTIYTKGFPRTFNMYIMFDFPFKTNPHLSLAIGPGVGTDNMYFDEMYVGVKDNTATLHFDDRSDTNHFKKYKLGTTYLEAPIEFRYSSKPDDPNKSWKAAIGVKVGANVAAGVKGKVLQDKNDNVILDYTEKEKSRHFFNTYRFAAIARFGWGPFTVFGSYQFNSLLKEGTGPNIKPYNIGLTLSGL